MEKAVLYTVMEIADILKVSRRTVYNYISDGNLKAIKIGKMWRIKKSDFEDFLNDGIKK